MELRYLQKDGSFRSWRWGRLTGWCSHPEGRPVMCGWLWSCEAWLTPAGTHKQVIPIPLYSSKYFIYITLFLPYSDSQHSRSGDRRLESAERAWWWLQHTVLQRALEIMTKNPCQSKFRLKHKLVADYLKITHHITLQKAWYWIGKGAGTGAGTGTGLEVRMPNSPAKRTVASSRVLMVTVEQIPFAAGNESRQRMEVSSFLGLFYTN